MIVLSEPHTVLLVLAFGTFSTVVLTTLSYFTMSWRTRRKRHVAPAEWPDSLFYFGICLTWVMAAAVGYWTP